MTYSLKQAVENKNKNGGNAMLQRFTQILLALTFLAGTAIKAETLLEVKDEFGRPVLVVTSEGLTILNANDTIMVINSNRINAFIQQDAAKGLSRTFSVTTPASVKGVGTNVLNVSNDGLSISNETEKLMDITGSNITAYVNNDATNKALSRKFSVTTTSAKGLNLLDVSTDGLSVSNQTEKLMDITGSNITAYVNDYEGKALSRKFSVSTTSASPVPLLNVSGEGMTIRNLHEKLMDIVGSNITAYIGEDPATALSRTFAVTTTASKEGGSDVLAVAPDGLRIRSKDEKLMDITKKNITAYIDEEKFSNEYESKGLSRSFSVTTSSSKGKTSSVLDVAGDGLRVRNENEQLVKELEILRAEIDLLKRQISSLLNK
jgi:hypothetical protein